MTKESAEELVRRIYSYWDDQGFQVKVWAERDLLSFNANNQQSWIVRSDLVGGIPAGYNLSYATIKIARGKNCEQ